MSAQSLPANVKNEYWALGIYQIFGGALGLVFLVVFILIDFNSSANHIITSICFLLLYAYGVLCGSLCLKMHRAALQHTIGNQALQISWFAILGLSYKYGAGFYIAIGADITDSFEFVFNVGLSTLNLSFIRHSDKIMFAVNIVAVWVVLRAMHLRKILANNVEV